MMGRRFAIVSLLLVLGLAPSVFGDTGSESKPLGIDLFPDPAQFEKGSREWLRAIDALKYRPLADGRLIDNCPHSFDVLHYNIALYIDFIDEIIYGDTRVIAVSEEDHLSSIDLDLTVLTVDSVFCGPDTATYVHNDPVLSIDLGQSHSVGDSFEVRVFYHGHPGNEGPAGFGGFYFDGRPKIAFQMGVGLEADPPSMGKYWFPCWDWPCDKASAEYHITTQGTGRKVVCNGILLADTVDTLSNTRTFAWSETHQIAPHVMTVHARKYTELVDSVYDWIHYWIYPEDTSSAAVHFENVYIMMDGFIERYGTYPFDKFGYVTAPKGDMEHQTCVTHVRSVIQPHHIYDWLLAHEMAHQWWGDCVSVNTWENVWLSEGFATYSEAIFHEHAYGMASYHDYVANDLMHRVFMSGENFPIYDPNYLWGTTVYEKGACVLHMLRHVVGDSIFYAGLAAYRAAHEYESATTPQFKQVMEGVHGQSLDWFFNKWIYDKGWPVYEYSWIADSTAGGYDMEFVIDQVQTNGPIFTMPVDVKITTVAGDTSVILWSDETHDVFDLVLDAEPTVVEFDPDNWILDEHEEVAHAGLRGIAAASDVRLGQNVPNPFSETTTIRYLVPRAQNVRLEIYNTAGQKVIRLLSESVSSGWGEVVWDGRDDRGEEVASGAYFCRLITEDGCLQRSLMLLR
jgi:aminopeptidase N